jgi:hypothetical protein
LYTIVTWSGFDLSPTGVFWSITADGIAMAAWASSILFLRGLLASLMVTPSISSATASTGTTTNQHAQYIHIRSISIAMFLLIGIQAIVSYTPSQPEDAATIYCYLFAVLLFGMKQLPFSLPSACSLLFFQSLK